MWWSCYIFISFGLNDVLELDSELGLAYGIILILYHSSKCYYGMNARGSYWWYVNIGAGDGLLQALPEPVLTKIYVTIWYHYRPQWVNFSFFTLCIYWCFLKCYYIDGTWWLSHWGRVTHLCVGNVTIINSDNGLSSGWYQAIIWTIAGIMLIGCLGTKFSEILIEICTYSLKKAFETVIWKMSTILSWPQCVIANWNF